MLISPFRDRKSMSLFFPTQTSVKRKYGCLMAVIPEPLASQIRSWGETNIPDHHLGVGGREDKIHVTVKYGYEEDEGLNLRELLTNYGIVRIKLNTLSLFRGNKDGDVLKIGVQGNEIRELNEFVSLGFPIHDKYPEYKPHLTIAYLNPQFSVAYTAMKLTFLNQEIIIDTLEWSSAEKKKLLIPLLESKKSMSYLGELTGGALVGMSPVCSRRKVLAPFVKSTPLLSEHHQAWTEAKSLDAQFKAAPSSQHPIGVPFQGNSGRWFIRRQQDGQVVPAKGPSGNISGTKKPLKGEEPGSGNKMPKPDKPALVKKPKEKKPVTPRKPAVKKSPAPKRVKLTSQNAHERITEMISAGKMNDEDKIDLGNYLMGLTVVQLKQVKDNLGIKAFGVKADLARKLASEALRKPIEKNTPEKESTKTSDTAKQPEKLEEFLKQSDPGNPVAKTIRENTKALEKVSSIISIGKGLAKGKYQDIVAKQNKLNQIVKTKNEVLNTYGEKSRQYDKVFKEWVNAWGEVKDADLKELEMAKKEMRVQVMNTLKAKNPPSISKKLANGFQPEPHQSEMIDNGINFVQSITEWSGMGREVTFKNISNRAHFDMSGGWSGDADLDEDVDIDDLEGLVKAKGDPSVNIGDQRNTNVGSATMAHELGHMIETMKPGVMRKIKDFLEYRLKDEPLVDMGSVPGGGGLKGEMGRKDNFDRVFDGTSAYYVGKNYTNKKGQTYASEVLSMGIQALYQDAVEFCQKDPEYAAFVIGILQDEEVEQTGGEDGDENDWDNLSF